MIIDALRTIPKRKMKDEKKKNVMKEKNGIFVNVNLITDNEYIIYVYISINCFNKSNRP